MRPNPSVNATRYGEVTLSTGRGHAAFAGDEIDWIQPIVDWVHGK